MIGTEDTFKEHLNVHKLFEAASNPIVVTYNEGHRFPRRLSDEGFTALKDFVRARYEEKNGDDAEFDVEYTEYNFNVRHSV